MDSDSSYNSEEMNFISTATIVTVILFSSLAMLASTGTNIILQKDWIVVITDNDTDMLASN